MVFSCTHVKLSVTLWVQVLVTSTPFRASFHVEFINYFELQGFDLLADWKRLPSSQNLHLDFSQIAMQPSVCPGYFFFQYTFSLLTFGSFRFLSHISSQKQVILANSISIYF